MKILRSWRTTSKRCGRNPTILFTIVAMGGGNALRRLGTQESMLVAVVTLNLAAFMVAMVTGVLFGFDRFFFTLLIAVVLFAVATVGDAAKHLRDSRKVSAIP